MIPNTEFITTFLNIRDSDLEYFFVSTENSKTYYNVQLKRKLFPCPYCRCETIGYGHRMKTIYHPVLRDTNGYIKYNANRCLCKGCGKISMEPNPFAFSEFNSSYLLLDEVMKKLKNLSYTLGMISEELNISTTQINNYLSICRKSCVRIWILLFKHTRAITGMSKTSLTSWNGKLQSPIHRICCVLPSLRAGILKQMKKCFQN